MLISAPLCRAHTDQQLLGYIEDYFTSMQTPHTNTPKLYAWFTGLEHWFFNSVVHCNYTTNRAHHVDALLNDAPEGKPIAFYINQTQDAAALIDVLCQRGFTKTQTDSCMAWQVKDIEKPTHTVKRATEKTLNAFHTILAIAYESDDAMRDGYRALLDQSKASEQYLVYLDGTPVGTGTLFVTGNVGCIFNISVLPEYRQKGAGTALSQFLMHTAYKRGLETMVLLSEPTATNMYKKLGFVTQFDVDIYARD